jgi:hypothetical protein
MFFYLVLLMTTWYHEEMKTDFFIKFESERD